jgi:hypothetical protein
MKRGMSRFFTVAIVLAMIPAFSQAQLSNASPVGNPAIVAAKGFTITGDISGLTKGATVKLVNANTNAELATAVVQEKKTTVKKNGKMVPVTKSFFILK